MTLPEHNRSPKPAARLRHALFHINNPFVQERNERWRRTYNPSYYLRRKKGKQ